MNNNTLHNLKMSACVHINTRSIMIYYNECQIRKSHVKHYVTKCLSTGCMNPLHNDDPRNNIQNCTDIYTKI